MHHHHAVGENKQLQDSARPEPSGSSPQAVYRWQGIPHKLVPLWLIRLCSHRRRLVLSASLRARAHWRERESVAKQDTTFPLRRNDRGDTRSLPVSSILRNPHLTR